MAIGFVELQGQITRTQDYSAMKHNEDNKAMVEQSTIGQQMTKQVQRQNNKVNHADQSSEKNRKFDAKEKGSNEYYGDGGKRRKKEDAEEDGKVILKGVTRFDARM